MEWWSNGIGLSVIFEYLNSNCKSVGGGGDSDYTIWYMCTSSHHSFIFMFGLGFVCLLLSTLVCCQPTELIWAFCVSWIFPFYPPPPRRWPELSKFASEPRILGIHCRRRRHSWRELYFGLLKHEQYSFMVSLFFCNLVYYFISLYCIKCICHFIISAYIYTNL